MKSQAVYVGAIVGLAIAWLVQSCSACPQQFQAFAAPACSYNVQAAAFTPVYQPRVQFVPQLAPVASYGAAFAVPAPAFVQKSYGVQASFGTVAYAPPVAFTPSVGVAVNAGRVNVDVGRQRRAFFLPGRQVAANQALSATLGVPARAVR